MNTPLKVTVRKIKDSYKVSVDSYSQISIVIDGKRFDDFKEGWMPSMPTEILSVSTKYEIESFSDENGNSQTPAAYDIGIKKLTANATRGGAYEYWEFPSLEAEYEYKKYVKQWTPMQVLKEIFDPCKIVFHDITGNIDNEYIVPFRFIGKEPVKDDKILHLYTANPYRIACQIATELGFQEVEDDTWGKDGTAGMKWCVPDHSKDTLRFLKINKKYANYDSLPRFSNLEGTYEECLQRYERDRVEIGKLFQHALNLMHAVGKTIDKAQVAEKLKGFSSSLQQVEARKSDVNRLIGIRLCIGEYINELLSSE